ncbi:MAG TPA: hypothetical protein DD670_02290, partial [Planctomycetaceae bacterium]|nr:hypothetical protein [Planctomycetaceae bacterium]
NYALSAQSLRGTDHKPNDVLLIPDGGNLASVIYRLKTSDERSYRRLLEHLRRVDPRIDLINFNVPSEDNVFMFFEDKAGNRLPAMNASSGTLRFLALTYILMGQPVGDLCPLLIIEEPENGIYVGFLKDLLDIAEAARQPSQLVFTSHSPYFIDLFDDRLDSVFFVKGGERHSTLSQPEPDEVRKRLESFPLGEQHFREMLA